MIVTNAIILHIPIIILMYGSNSSPSNPWVYPYMVYEKIQVTMFFLQEVIILAIYIKACSSFLGIQSALYGNGVRKMRRHLLLVNVIIILLDIPILILEYADFYDFQTAYKAIVYSVKLKLEFNILNRLVKMANSNEISGLRSEGPDTDTAAGIHLNMFNGDASSRNVSYRVYAHGGEHGDTTAWNTGGWSMSDGIMRSTEITVDCVKRGEDNNENIERKLIGTGEHHYRTRNGMGGLSKSSSELNLATRGF
ncbi:hypothetical protein CEP51_015723 [Fusarium floridanum]|uniref:DUF7703 domain-containing protein n=1 Tax=Fusarium floridanum TaxID=1325733 RepID=A0A428P451_9HYPO|nr:hypothetical protein CEP51_015723 [Fusarium floridanum]